MVVPNTFDEGVAVYARAVGEAYRQTGDISKTRDRVKELRNRILSLPSEHGISKHFRLDQVEAKAISEHTAIQEAEIVGESHD